MVEEAENTPVQQAAYVNASSRDTVHSRSFTGKPCRMLRNDWTRRPGRRRETPSRWGCRCSTWCPAWQWRPPASTPAKPSTWRSIRWARSSASSPGGADRDRHRALGVGIPGVHRQARGTQPGRCGVTAPSGRQDRQGVCGGVTKRPLPPSPERKTPVCHPGLPCTPSAGRQVTGLPTANRDTGPQGVCTP